MPADDKRLGNLLVERKLVPKRAVDQALAQQQRGAVKPLASQLREAGALSEIDALRALSEQLGVPGIDLTQVAIVLEHLDVVPREVAEAHRILPVLVRGDRIFLAMADPSDKRVIDELEFVTGKRIYPYVVLVATLERTLSAAYDARENQETYFLGTNVPEATLRALGIQKSTPAGPAEARTADPPLPKPIVDAAVARAASEPMPDAEPLAGEDPSSPHRSPSLVPRDGRRRVLVVDDEVEIRRMLSRLLRDHGFEVLEADRGQLALKMVREETPDLIILDAMLPEIHGFDIARRIRGSAMYGSIPIIMISAVYRGKSIAEDLKANYGIEEYLEKPFRIVDVIAALKRVIAKSDEAPARDPEGVGAEARAALEAGMEAYKAGDMDAAVEHLKRGVTLDPLAYKLHLQLGLLYGRKGMVFEGIASLEKAVDLHDASFAAKKNLAVLYEKAGFKQKALQTWQKALGQAPDDAARATIKQRITKLS